MTLAAFELAPALAIEGLLDLQGKHTRGIQQTPQLLGLRLLKDLQESEVDETGWSTTMLDVVIALTNPSRERRTSLQIMGY
jgi:hypothetical protein